MQMMASVLSGQQSIGSKVDTVQSGQSSLPTTVANVQDKLDNVQTDVVSVKQEVKQIEDRVQTRLDEMSSEHQRTQACSSQLERRLGDIEQARESEERDLEQKLEGLRRDFAEQMLAQNSELRTTVTQQVRQILVKPGPGQEVTQAADSSSGHPLVDSVHVPP